MSVLFYTAANEEYEHFAPVYIYFALRSNPNSRVEIGLEDANSFRLENDAAIRVLRNEFGDRFKFTTVDFDGILPGAVRFITEPELADTCEYVYIGDIDILIFDEDIQQAHLENMATHNAPFSNIIREPEDTRADRYKLSGLHFAPTDHQYPLPDLTEIDYSVDNPIRGADEHVLYQIMEKQGEMIPRKMDYRPEHGLHMRTFSHPFGQRSGWRGPEFSFCAISNGTQEAAWTGLERQKYREAFLNALQEDAFQDLYFNLDILARNHLTILENACAGRFEEFEQEAYYYILSNYINQRLVRRKLSRTFGGTLYRSLQSSRLMERMPSRIKQWMG